MNITRSDIPRIDAAIEKMVEARVRAGAGFRAAAVLVATENSLLFHAVRQLRAGRSTKESVPYEFDGEALVPAQGNQGEEDKLKQLELPASVEQAAVEITAAHAALSDLQAQADQVAADISELSRNLATNEKVIRERDMQVAMSGEPVPDDAYPEEAARDKLKRQHRVLTARKSLLQGRIRDAHAKIARLAADLREAWHAHSDQRADAALERYRVAVAQAADAFAEIRCWSRDFHSGMIRHERKASIPGVLVASEGFSPHAPAIVNSNDMRWGEGVEKSDAFALIDGQRRELLALIKGGKTEVQEKEETVR